MTMKFSTSLAFFFTGLLLFSLSLENRSGVVEMLISTSALIILLLMFSLLASVLVSIDTGIEDLFVKESPDAIKTTVPGRPSIGTMLGFVLVAAAGFFDFYYAGQMRKPVFWSGIIIAFIGVVATVGYLINIQLLYYSATGVSTAMAFHTSILFILAGSSLVLSGTE